MMMMMDHNVWLSHTKLGPSLNVCVIYLFIVKTQLAYLSQFQAYQEVINLLLNKACIQKGHVMHMEGTQILHIKYEVSDTARDDTLPILKYLGIIDY